MINTLERVDSTSSQSQPLGLFQDLDREIVFLFESRDEVPKEHVVSLRDRLVVFAEKNALNDARIIQLAEMLRAVRTK